MDFRSHFNTFFSFLSLLKKKVRFTATEKLHRPRFLSGGKIKSAKDLGAGGKEKKKKHGQREKKGGAPGPDTATTTGASSFFFFFLHGSTLLSVYTQVSKSGSGKEERF